MVSAMLCISTLLVGCACLIVVVGDEDSLRDALHSNRYRTIEIVGIPEDDGENLTGIVWKVGDAIGIKRPVFAGGFQDIEALGRITTGLDKDTIRPIVVLLYTRRGREYWLDKGRPDVRFALTADMIDYKYPPLKVFLNEYLKPSKRKLLMMAKEFTRRYNFKFLWTKDTIIYMRKYHASTIYVIRNIADLQAVNRTLHGDNTYQPVTKQAGLIQPSIKTFSENNTE